MPTRRSMLYAGLAAPFLITSVRAAQPIADGKTVRLVVPFPPGGAVDMLGRLIADRMPAHLGNQVVVDNRGGAGGLIGADAVAKSDPDGTTLGILAVGVFCAYPYLYTRLPFDPAKDFTPISTIVTGTVMCVVNAETAARNGWTDFRSLILWARANPEQLRMGSSGNGTTSHFMLAALNAFAGAKILHVPYRGGAQAINDVLAGKIDMMFDVMPALMPHVEAGTMKAMAVGSAQRLPILPNVPGMSEFADLGLGEVDLQAWSAIVGPAGIPPATIARLHRAVMAVGGDRAFTQRLAPLGYNALVSASPTALHEQIEDDTPKWRQLVELSGAKLD